MGQRNQLFLNTGANKFSDVSLQAGLSFQNKSVSRGAAFGDIDNDGDTDVLVVNNSGKAELLINNEGSKRNWIGIRLTDKESGRDMLGAKIEVHLTSGKTLYRRVRTDGSYSSAHDPRVIVGLGSESSIKTVKIVWPDGTKGVLTDPLINKYNTITFGANGKK